MSHIDRDTEVFTALRAAVPVVSSGTEIPPHLKQFELQLKMAIRPKVLPLLQSTAGRLDIWRRNPSQSLWTPGERGPTVMTVAECRRRLAGNAHHFTQTLARLMAKGVLAALQYVSMNDVSLGRMATEVNADLIEGLGASIGEWLDDEMEPGLLVVAGYALMAHEKQPAPETKRTAQILGNTAAKLGDWARLSEGGFIAARFRAFGVDLGRALRHDIPEVPDEHSPFSADEFVLIDEGSPAELLAFAPAAANDLIINGPDVVRGESMVRVNCAAHRTPMGKGHMVVEMGHWMAELIRAYGDVME